MSWDRLTNKRPPPAGTWLSQECIMANRAAANELGPLYYVSIDGHLYLPNQGAPAHSVECACGHDYELG